ncbi:MAG: septum site-determining protein MinC [Phormidium sp. GEM2.Bin31]|nr:septum site-determining protein MinC [Phormidium sp. BM_Day4_Bin.17]TVR03966.1 MAG: septum site-determining protein MinC [Phormidium sp. GEM2.Bin31]UCJ10996.1 MAG: septum site-determining protein MinC [Phormidium sp. PBR-2020]
MASDPSLPTEFIFEPNSSNDITPSETQEERDSVEDPPPATGLNLHQQVRLKSEAGQVLLLLPPQSESAGELTWQELWQQLKHRLNAGDRFWQAQTPVMLQADDRLLDSRQLQEIDEALQEAQLKLERVSTYRRQTAVAAATAGYSVEQPSREESLHNSLGTAPAALAEPLYLTNTVRSGTEIRHPGTVVLVGDVNPGGAVIASGDILVWGRLRGIAHAGAAGNSQCLIMALQMDPTQIRIANAVARAPSDKLLDYYPEVAYVANRGIRISRAADFNVPSRGQ